MLSFFGIFLNDERSYQSAFRYEISEVNSKKRKKNTMSLQVLCSPLLIKSWTNRPGKRALPFISKKKYCASMTVEAAMVLPLFVFLALALLMPMRALDTERKIRTVMEKQGEEISLYAYMEADELKSENESKTESKTESKNLLSVAGVWLQLQGTLKAFGDSVKISSIQMPDQDENLTMKVVYQEPIPFFFNIDGGLKTEISVKRRDWVGLNGKLKEIHGGNGEMESGEEMVYVGKDMGRYHRDRNCHYISNAYQAVSVEEAKEMRDADRHRFTACSACADTISKNGTVYVTPGGRHYHGSTDCTAMVSYVRKVPISEVLYLGACSYCSGE